MYTRNSGKDVIQQIGAITSIDVVNQKATAMMRDGSSVQVAIIYATGATQVTPALGEQWLLQKTQAVWRLDQRLPFNNPTDTIPRTQGQHIVGGGNGPVELAGTSINAGGPVVLNNTSTANRPDPVAAGAGATVYDTTLNKPIHSDGTVWRDAMGNAV